MPISRQSCSNSFPIKLKRFGQLIFWVLFFYFEIDAVCCFCSFYLLRICCFFLLHILEVYYSSLFINIKKYNTFFYAIKPILLNSLMSFPDRDKMLLLLSQGSCCFKSQFRWCGFCPFLNFPMRLFLEALKWSFDCCFYFEPFSLIWLYFKANIIFKEENLECQSIT